MRARRLGVVMDPIESIHPKKDSSLALMLEAQSRGWAVCYMTLNDLALRNGRAEATMYPVQLWNDPDHWFEKQDKVTRPLGDLDVILMRKDPPFDMEYIMSTYVLERAEAEGVLVLNKPQSLRDVNEKVFTAWFPQCCPPGLFTRSKEQIRAFILEHGKAVIKPTGRMGGQSVFVVAADDGNMNVIIEQMTDFGKQFVQVQAYVPAIVEQGDKRILLINGEPIPQAITRIPGHGDHRGNLAVGAKAAGVELNDRDQWICSQIGPELKRRSLFFVGIDVIGDYLTEINVTSPTGILEIDHHFGTNIAGLFFDALEPLLASAGR